MLQVLHRLLLLQPARVAPHCRCGLRGPLPSYLTILHPASAAASPGHGSASEPPVSRCVLKSRAVLRIWGPDTIPFLQVRITASSSGSLKFCSSRRVTAWQRSQALPLGIRFRGWSRMTYGPWKRQVRRQVDARPGGVLPTAPWEGAQGDAHHLRQIVRTVPL
jgi:hypothetical protein